MESIGTSAESIAHAFVRAINRQDAEQVAALMSPTHRFIDSLGNVVEGREKMREGWAAYFRMVPDYSVAIEEIYPSDPVVIMIGMAQGTYSSDAKLHPEHGAPADGSSSAGCKNRWQTPVAIRALVEDGLVAEWRVYADNEPLRKLMASGK